MSDDHLTFQEVPDALAEPIGSANQYAPETFSDGNDDPIIMGFDPALDKSSFFFTTRSKPFDMDRFNLEIPAEMPIRWTWDTSMDFKYPDEPEVPQWKRNRDAMSDRFERRRQERNTREEAGEFLDQAESDFAAAIHAFKIFKEYLDKSAVSWDKFIVSYDNLPDTKED